MATTINTVVGNSAPPIVLTLKRGSTAIDLTGCSVTLILKKGSTIVNTGHQTATVTSATSGIISYVPRTTDFATAGTYKANVQITYGDSTVEILYNQQKFKARAQ